MIEHITNLLKGSIFFIVGFIFGIIANLVGFSNFFFIEVFGIPLLVPMVFILVFIGYFIIIFFKKDKIEQIKKDDI